MKFLCKIIIFLGDNKEQNQRLDFVGSFVGLHCCRYCRMHLRDIRTKVSSKETDMRNRENYNADVAAENETATGVKQYSIFNTIPCFHATESSAIDLTHNLTEGSLHTSFAHSIRHFIKKKYFDLEFLNDRIKSINFGRMEEGNKPSIIKANHLSAFKFRMSASEMFFFTHHFTLLVGSRVPNDDPVWHHVLTTVRFFDLCYLPIYHKKHLDALSSTSIEFISGVKDLFDINLQHKSHLATHYTELTQKYGPMRYIQTIR